jgi:hypothetical protein
MDEKKFGVVARLSLVTLASAQPGATEHAEPRCLLLERTKPTQATRSFAQSAGEPALSLVWSGPMFLRIAFCTLVAASACDKPAPTREEPRAAPTPPPAAAARYDSPQAVYKRYAETLGAAQWAEAIALFTQAGKAELVVANFKGLAVLPGSPHPKKLEFKEVMHEFCRDHSLRCADETWNQTFAPTLLAGASTKALLSDVSSLAKARPEATYIEIMTLVYGVDQRMVMPLDPTLSDVKHTDNTATGTARRSDGQTTTMRFENTPERGWLIVE